LNDQADDRFDIEAEEAANFYVSVFENSCIRQINRHGEAGREVHGKAAAR
jgi:predicted 3-demethylubiquinone-9 3-methyltransferase (glyoxalase superfamily)